MGYQRLEPRQLAMMGILGLERRWIMAHEALRYNVSGLDWYRMIMSRLESLLYDAEFDGLARQRCRAVEAFSDWTTPHRD